MIGVSVPDTGPRRAEHHMNASTKRFRLSLLAAASACVLVTGCTGTTSSDDDGDGGDGDGAGTVKWLIEEPEDAEALQALKDHVAEDFTEESGITVEIDTLPFENMRTVLQTQLRSGEGPDVFNWGSGPSFGGALAEAGLLLDLTDAYETNGWEVFDFAKETVTVDGKIYGVPGELETIGVFYNKDMFSELGLEEPQSLADLEAAASAATDAGVVAMAAPDKEGWEGGHYVSMALGSEAGADEMRAIINGEQSWDSPSVVAAFELWKRFNDEGYLVESPTSVDYDTAIAQYWSGEAAMIPTGSWLVGELDDNAEFESGYIPFPSSDGQGTFTAGLGSGPFVSASTDDEEAAVEFVDFLASPEHGDWIVENLHTIPPIPIETEGLDVSPLFAQVLSTTAELAGTGEFGQNIDVAVSDAVNEAMYDGFQGILTGQMSPEEAAAGMADAAGS
jgi:raffinose/stachyose/melibiose transport system substrate-binding protein